MLNAYIMEFFGTFLFIFTILYFSSNFLKKAFFGGIVLAICIYLGGLFSISSITLPYNPLVAICLFISKQITLKDLILFLFIEFGGTLLALFVYMNYFFRKK